MIDFGLFAVPSEKGRGDINIETRKQKSKVSPGQERGETQKHSQRRFSKSLIWNPEPFPFTIACSDPFPSHPSGIIVGSGKTKVEEVSA
jgi:hypothetical protein